MEVASLHIELIIRRQTGGAGRQTDDLDYWRHYGNVDRAVTKECLGGGQGGGTAADSLEVEGLTGFTVGKGDIDKLSPDSRVGQGYPCHGLVTAGDPDRNAAVAGAAQSDGIRRLKARANPAVAVPAVSKGDAWLGDGYGDH